ncbi:MAG: hypothetical protein EXS22_08340 [Pedosphaera sp.]|nr:hypothetical protein [Pedosphaera sp.]MSU44029.1 hypothetical protein [Pedosphaera sp.]
MDFFARQEQARRQTGWLVFYFALAIASVIAAVYLVFAGITAGERGPHFDPDLFAIVAGGTGLVIGLGSAFRVMELSAGGQVVAEMLGGRLIAAGSTDPSERRLLNVVEEMAIASGVPVPPVYLMDEEDGINAFAAGNSTSDAVIGVTRGALAAFTRDELQGVVAHEFSHILNGDMRLNIRLMGLLNGILLLAIIGRILIQTGGMGRSRSRNGEKNPLPLIGLALLLIGGLGVFFGRLIQSAVSRQREHLADASAVQFTRNPAGLAGALRRILSASQGSKLETQRASEASHLFFNDAISGFWSSLFATHPPLEERIQLLDSSFVAAPPEESAAPSHLSPPQLATGLVSNIAPTMGKRKVRAQEVTRHIGTPAAPSHAAELIAQIPAPLADAAREPYGARALVYALLLSPDATQRQQQLTAVRPLLSPDLSAAMEQMHRLTLDLPRTLRLPLVEMALPSLRNLPPAQHGQFQTAVIALVESDGSIDIFEYALQKMLRRHLQRNFQPAGMFHTSRPTAGSLRQHCAVLLSCLAHAGHDDERAAKSAFATGATLLPARIASTELLPIAEANLAYVDLALDALQNAALPLKRDLLAACAATIAADGYIMAEEAELLRAIGDTLDCPIPPINVDNSRAA